ncbi:MAG: hypothetical protein KAY12_02225 [Arenimonas sp.]|nr:hypothetical protein [Arenimonas sp.]
MRHDARLLAEHAAMNPPANLSDAQIERLPELLEKIRCQRSVSRRATH